MSIGSRIRRARLRAKLSQAQLAAAMKVTRSAVSQWEMDRGTMPRGHRLERLAALLDVSFQWLATGEGTMDGGLHTADGTPGYRNGLTEDERDLLNIYTAMNKEARSALLVLMRSTQKRGR